MPDRFLKDTALKVTKALPAANANVNSASIDLGAAAPGISLEGVELDVAIEALPSLADAGTCTVTVQDSADDATFVAVAGLATLVSTGAGGVGAAAKSRRIRLPANVRRYVNVNTAVSNGGGDNTAKVVTAQLVF